MRREVWPVRAAGTGTGRSQREAVQQQQQQSIAECGMIW